MSLIEGWGYPVLDAGGYSRLLNEAGVFQDALELLQVRLAQDYLNVWALMPEGLDRQRTVQFLTEALAELQVEYGQDAAAIAAEFLNVQRQGMELPVVLADPAQAERVGGSVRWALTNSEAQSLLYGSMQRMALETYRQTIRLSAFEAGNGYARVPEPGACEFCLMLASRGAVYSSRVEAYEIGLANWSRDGVAKRKAREAKARAKGVKPDYGYHDKCKCDIIEVSPTNGLTEANIVLHDLWQKTFWGKDYLNNPQKQIDTVDFGSAFPVWQEVLADTDLPWMSGKQLTR